MSSATSAIATKVQPQPWLLDFLLLAAIWGSSFLFMRWGAAEFGPVTTAGLRVSVAALVLLPLLLARGMGGMLRRHWGVLLAAGLINSAIPFALFSYAVLSITTGLASILNATVPLFGAVVAWAWLGDRLGWLRWCGLATGFAGVVLLASGSTSLHTGSSGLWAVLACLGASCCYGLAASFAKRHLAGIPPVVTATGSQIGAALGLAVPAIWCWPARMPGPRAWAAVLAIAVLCTALAYLLYFRLIERAGPSRALAVTFLAPVFALGYGAALLGEPVTAWMLGSGAVIMAGTLLSTGLVRLRR